MRNGGNGRSQTLPGSCLAGVAALVLVVSQAAAGAPAIARPSLAGSGLATSGSRGVVFFLSSSLEPGVVAVGTAHTLRAQDLVRAGRVRFERPRSLELVAESTGYAAAPGLPLDAAGGTLAGDFTIYRLADSPAGSRVLEPEPGALGKLRPGVRVRMLGPATGSQVSGPERDVAGTVVEAGLDQIEIELDRPETLCGWGGAPVLLASSGRVVGMIEAAVPGEDTPRVLAAPIEGILLALAEPLGGGAGQTFAAYHRSAAQPAAEPEREDLEPAPLESLPASEMLLEVEYPPDGAEVAESACGVFVAGRAQATRGVARRFDVMLVIDTSRSTVDSSRADVNGNGEIGIPKLGRLGAVFGAPLTDPGDSILAAEVAAARQILRGLDPRSTRVGLIAFAGEPAVEYGRPSRRKPAYTVEALTRDYGRIERGLDELLDTTPEGSTHMAAGLDQATIELKGWRGAYSKADPESEKIVFFFTDGQPTLPYPDSEAENVRAVLRAANRAGSGQIRVHSFAIGPEALAGPIAAVEMASRTEGSFTPVRSPGDLVNVVEEVSFSELLEVQVENRRTRATADPFRVTADGSWAGFVTTQSGKNPLHVHAKAQDGIAAEKQLSVVRRDDVTSEPPVPRELVPLRNRLLEDCLILTQQRRLAQEAERNAELKRQLRLEIERERAAARERAEAQRKSLNLEVEED